MKIYIFDDDEPFERTKEDRCPTPGDPKTRAVSPLKLGQNKRLITAIGVPPVTLQLPYSSKNALFLSVHPLIPELRIYTVVLLNSGLTSHAGRVNSHKASLSLPGGRN
jgi:hypothetical protein